MASPLVLTRTKVLIPAILLTLVAGLLASIVLAPPRTPPAMLGASATLDGGLARINGVIPVEADGWQPPAPSAALEGAPGAEQHRVRLLVEFTALDKDGLDFDPARYTVTSLGQGSWKPVWSSPAPATARQGETIDATLIFELPDRAIDLTLELPGGPGLALGPGHHRGGK